jgi:hypothetical protein
MARGFGVGDLDGLTNRLRHAGEDLDDADTPSQPAVQG